MNRLDVLDQELARWRTAAGAALKNICELYDHPTYRALSGKFPTAPVPLARGSHDRVEKAVSSVDELLILASNLNTVIDRATELRRSMPLLFQSERIAEIENLLCGASVTLPPPDLIPLAERGLLDNLDAGQRMITPEKLLGMMQSAFESARDTIFVVSHAWTSLPAELKAFEAEICALESNAGAWGETLVDLKQAVQKTYASLRADPLGAVESLENDMCPRLAKVRAELDNISRNWNEAKNELGAARDLARQLLEIHAHADAASEECRRKVEVDPRPTKPLDDSTIRALDEWLDRLCAQIESGPDWQAARIGLEHWQARARSALSGDRAALEAADALMRERLTLRGLLDALQAKANGHALAEDAELADAFEEARKLLYSRPTPMALARQRVAHYQAMLNARIGKS